MNFSEVENQLLKREYKFFLYPVSRTNFGIFNAAAFTDKWNSEWVNNINIFLKKQAGSEKQWKSFFKGFNQGRKLQRNKIGYSTLLEKVRKRTGGGAIVRITNVNSLHPTSINSYFSINEYYSIDASC